jgi:hypothetical protein
LKTIEPRVLPSIGHVKAENTRDMGATEELGLKPGVITGDDVLHVTFPKSDCSRTSSLNMLVSINSPFQQSYGSMEIV